jgi:ribonuclease HI
MGHMHLTIHFDGSCWPNPGGLAKHGWTLRADTVHGPHLQSHGFVGDGPLMSNNLAEFFAMASGLEAAYMHLGRVKSVTVIGDSEIAIRLMTGRYRANPEKLYYPQYTRAISVVKEIKKAGVHVEFKWVPREQNTECDELSKLPAAKPVEPTLLDEAEALLL